MTSFPEPSFDKKKKVTLSWSKEEDWALVLLLSLFFSKFPFEDTCEQAHEEGISEVKCGRANLSPKFEV